MSALPSPSSRSSARKSSSPARSSTLGGCRDARCGGDVREQPFAQVGGHAVKQGGAGGLQLRAAAREQPLAQLKRGAIDGFARATKSQLALALECAVNGAAGGRRARAARVEVSGLRGHLLP